ncbi:MAG: hypothetical protein ACUVV6_06660 [Thermoplasmatota archaeon]
MPRIEIEVPKETLDVVVDIWRMTRRRISEEVLRQLGWEDLAAFAGDLLVVGFETASDDPRSFILQMRERKAPIFKPSGASYGAGGEADEIMRAYS